MQPGYGLIRALVLSVGIAAAPMPKRPSKQHPEPSKLPTGSIFSPTWGWRWTACSRASMLPSPRSLVPFKPEPSTSRPSGKQKSAQHPRVPTTRAERLHLAAEARRQARYAHLDALQQEGHSIQAMARLAGVARNTVRRYLRSGGSVEQATRGRRPHACDRFAPYLRARWEAGEHNSAVLLAELRAQGFTGSPSTLRQYLMAWRTGPRRPGRQPTDASSRSAGTSSRRRTFSPRQTRWILLQPLDELDARNKPIVSSCARSR